IRILTVDDHPLLRAGIEALVSGHRTWWWSANAQMLVVVLEGRLLFSPPHDPWTHILLATLGGALTLLGPGAWSVDARLFGWKRIDINPSKRPSPATGGGAMVKRLR